MQMIEITYRKGSVPAATHKIEMLTDIEYARLAVPGAVAPFPTGF